MKVSSFAVVALLSAGFTQLAYAFPHQGGGGECHMQRIAHELHLTDQQRQQMKQIYRDNRNTGMTIHDGMQDNRDAMHKLDPGAKDYSAQVEKLANAKAKLVKQMVIHRAQVRSQMFAVLTPEQQAKAAELKKHRDAGDQGGFHPGDAMRHCNH